MASRRRRWPPASTTMGYLPLVVVDGEYSASLDGITLSGDRILEIKSPVTGRDSALWQAVEGGGHLPEYYQLQVQHQLWVAKGSWPTCSSMTAPMAS